MAVRLAAHPTAPSFEAWRLAGHSTLLEHWGPIDRSHAHYFQGAGVKWLYEDLAGLRRSSPGWSTFEVAPRFPESVHQVSFRRRTPLGTIEVGWRRDGAHIVVDVEVIGAMRGTLLLDGIREDLEEGHTSRRIR